MGFGGYDAPRRREEVVREVVREVPDRRCVLGHQLSACGKGFRLNSGEHIGVRVIDGMVHVGCVRLTVADWNKLVASVAERLPAES